MEDDYVVNEPEKINWKHVTEASGLSHAYTITKKNIKKNFLKKYPDSICVSMNDYIDALFDLYPDTDLKVLKLKIETEATKFKRINIPVSVRITVWETWLGEVYKAKCPICAKDIKCMDSWDASHIIASSKGGTNDLENLRPLCHTCNVGMRDMHMVVYIKRYYPKRSVGIFEVLKLFDL